MKYFFSILVPILVLGFSGMGSGCASPQRAPAAVSTDAKTQEYLALRENLLSLHRDSKFVESDPRLFDGKLVDLYPKEFIETHCSKDVPSNTCAQSLNQDVLSKLSQHYFAADMMSVATTCRDEPLICDDLNALETLFRNLHNSGIERSEHEKLDLIEVWRQGQMSDEQLKAALHLDFRFVNGKLEMSLPSS